MFSTAQKDYIEALLPTYAKDGYKYYVVYTDSVSNSSSWYSSEPDLYAIFSKKAISAKSAYSYDIGESSIIVSVRTGNYSSNSSAVNDSRVTVSDYAAQSINIAEYEHIYTNAEFEGHTLQPDYYLASGGETNVQVKTISFIMLIVCAYIMLSKLWFGRR